MNPGSYVTFGVYFIRGLLLNVFDGVDEVAGVSL